MAHKILSGVLLSFLLITFAAPQQVYADHGAPSADLQTQTDRDGDGGSAIVDGTSGCRSAGVGSPTPDGPLGVILLCIGLCAFFLARRKPGDLS